MPSSTAPNLNLPDYVGVITTFIDAYNAFNTQDLATLGNLIADDAVLYSVNSGTEWRPKTAILPYLQDKFTTVRPICALVSIELFPPSLPTTVRGEAVWSYTGNGIALPNPTTFPIKYEFRIQPDRPYLITSMWARPV
jgi:hypothetical protein